MLQAAVTVGLRTRDLVLMVLTLAIGLAADVRTDIVGQSLIGACVWLLFFYLMARLERPARLCAIVCLTIATLGELALSLGWGLYSYRLGNIPLFVPPGHVFLLLAGIALSQRISENGARLLFVAAGCYAVVMSATGIDTFAPLLGLVLLATWFALPSHRRLYAGTFLVSLLLELYGTSLGNWTWAPDVPGIALATTNPPALVGAFYSALDALVAVTILGLNSSACRSGSSRRQHPSPPENVRAIPASGSARRSP
jgi:hypothetical protein